jgi:hypothetical protein
LGALIRINEAKIVLKDKKKKRKINGNNTNIGSADENK